MILEVLVSSTPTDKTFFTKNVLKKQPNLVGSTCKIKISKKKSSWINFKRHKKLKLNFKLLKLSKILEDIIFTKR